MDAFREAIESKLHVRVITINGFQMCGVIIDESDDYIVIRVNGNKKIVFKHAISTVEAA